MKRNYNILLLTLLLAFASCSFTTKKIDADGDDKDKLLIQLITYVIDQGHFSPKDINDDFSKNVYKDYLNQIDPFKRYFLKSDIKEFKAYETKIDDQIKDRDLSFFNLTHERLLQRKEESKAIYKEILETPFDFDKKESYSADYEALDYAKSKKDLKERWRQQLKFSAIANYHDIIDEQEKSEEKTEQKSIIEIEKEARQITLTSLDELFSFIDDRRREDWFSVYINAVVEEFDPHTAYLAPTDRDRFDFQMSGKLEGIGAVLQKKIDKITVNTIVSGGPAWRQNELQVGDVILKVKQEDEDEAVSIVGMRIDDAIKLIKGPKGTKVTLTLKKVDGGIEDITITRDVVEQEETYAKTSIVKKEGRNFGVINLPGFYADFKDYNKRNAAADIKVEIERLKEQGMEGLVLDLRNNGGGSLKTVVEMAGLFIKDGPVVQVRSTGEPKEVLRDKDKSISWDGPLVILVNELSASASEILAAAMQDYKRAIVIGSKQTYGKGTVQQLIDLNRMVRGNDDDLGGFKFTTQKYYRINGGSTQLEGVKSDVVVPDRYSYIDIGERDQDNPLPWDEIQPAEYNIWDNYFDYEATVKKSNERMQKSEQLQLIDENAKWIKKIRDRNMYSLNYKEYKQALNNNEKEAKKFEKLADYKTDLTFKSLPYEVALIEKDTVLKEKRKRWHNSLSKDVYMEEALNVLNDLKTSFRIKKLATTVKD
ncbi:tail-specific protease [Flavobacteriaceae bacterium AU392]|nr:tail-specific protease [Flavobacteriaceae bacterium]RKM86967.1 tail-specific protease [Flavobacteriaceae bacterium AU392]